MKKTLDVKLINPFLQATVEMFKNIAGMNLTIGKPELSDLVFSHEIFVVQAGLTGNLKGQILLVYEENNAKKIASNMMGGMPVNELDEMACSALNEMCNMIMGNSATIFSTLDVFIDITPPILLRGSKLEFKSDIQALKIPLVDSDGPVSELYVCIAET